MKRYDQKRQRNRKRNGRTAGFTLLELMVALVAGLIAITSIYFVSSASSRHFHEQQRIAQTQMSLRMAMEQMRRDVQRAGYLGTPNSRQEKTDCLTPPTQIQALRFQNDEDTGALPNASENGVTADRLTLTGNFATGGAYWTRSVTGGGGTVRLQTDWQGFRRDFGVFGRSSGRFAYDPEAFEAVFAENRYLHVRTQENQHFFVRITSVDGSNASVSVTPNLPVGTSCMNGFGRGAVVAPLSQVEYRVMDLTASGDDGEHLEPLTGRVSDTTSDYRGQAATQLIRRERQIGGGLIDGTERIVLEYIANVDYEFVLDMETNVGDPPDLQRFRGDEAETEIDSNPERVRSVIAQISARTAEQDPRFPWVGSAAGDPTTGTPPTRYKVHTSGDYEGAARVRTLRQETTLHNVANRVMRP